MNNEQKTDARSWAMFLVIGLVAGWLASLIIGGGNILVFLISGVIGGFVGPLFLRIIGGQINLGSKVITDVVISAIGAVLVVLLARLFL